MWILRLMLLHTLPGSLEPLRSNPRNYEASPIWEGAKSPLPTIAIFFLFRKVLIWHCLPLVITARILVSKLSESGNTTFSVDHHDDASSKTKCGETFALLVVGSTHLHPFFCPLYPVKIDRIAFFSNFVPDQLRLNPPKCAFGVTSGKL